MDNRYTDINKNVPPHLFYIKITDKNVFGEISEIARVLHNEYLSGQVVAKGIAQNNGEIFAFELQLNHPTIVVDWELVREPIKL